MAQVERLGEWLLRDMLGAGGNGTMWRAQDEAGRVVALKLLHAAVVADRERMARIERAVAEVAKLEHAGIVTVQSLERHDGDAYIISDYHPHASLAHLVSWKGAMSVEQACRVAVTAADALIYAHALGVLHTNLKLENILVPDSGSVLLTDFGLAAPITTPGDPLLDIAHLYGNPAYLAPELVRGGSPQPTTDLYALGLILYAMLAGRAAFSGDPSSIVQQQLMEQPLPLDGLRPQLPPPLVQIVNTAIAKDPAVRYPDVSAFAAAVREFFIPWYVTQMADSRTARQSAPSPPPPTPPAELASPRPRNTTKLAVPPPSPPNVTVGTRPRMVRKVMTTDNGAIIPRPVDHIKGPTLPTRMLSLRDVQGRLRPTWLLGGLLLLVVAIIALAFAFGVLRVE